MKHRRSTNFRNYARSCGVTKLFEPSVTKDCIYVVKVECCKALKIGFSTNVWGRLSTMLSSSPCEFRLLATMTGTVQQEQELHRQLKTVATTLRGEWYLDTPELRTFLKEKFS